MIGIIVTRPAKKIEYLSDSEPSEPANTITGKGLETYT